MARSHEQPIALAATEANIGAALRQRDKADRLAFGIEHFDAVEVGVAHAPTAPQIAVHVDAEAVRRALRFGSDQDALVGKPRAIVDHVVGLDVTRRRAAVLDVAFGFVGRELDAVRAAQRALHYGGSAGFGIEAIDVGRQFDRRNVALVVVQDAEGRIGEPDRVVGFHANVVWRVEPLALNLSISTVIVPSYSVRVIRRVSCSQVTRRPWRSRRLPLAWLEGSR